MDAGAVDSLVGLLGSRYSDGSHPDHTPGSRLSNSRRLGLSYIELSPKPQTLNPKT
jgi:hypothetical protein